MNWTRISDQSLPPENLNVLVADHETITIARYVMDGAEIRWFFCCPSYNDLKITHWLELPPTPPKIVEQIVQPEPLVFES